MADTELALVEKAVIDVVLSREGKRRYSKGDPLTLDPSDLRDIVRLTMAKCAALASRPAEVDDSRKPPRTPEEMVAFIGNHYNAMLDEKADPADIEYALTVHDLLSAMGDWFEEEV